MGSAKGIAQFVIGSLILTAIVWGLIYYGPRLFGPRGYSWGGTPVKDMQLYPEQYLGHTVTVEGIFYGQFSEVSGAHTLCQDDYFIRFRGCEEPTLGWSSLMGVKIRVTGVVALVEQYGENYLVLENSSYAII